jgi:hypothetical protein
MFALYNTNSRRRTAALIWEALLYIDESDIKSDAESVIGKLERMSDEEFLCLSAECEGSYA